ncbi:phosphatase PAP2 family protein [Terriglobus roseus]|uniref:Acid phosphatase (Class A) n=1 Tax=Terriglobus roseus TaxID=392734 RepID=A0A1H4S0E9_9BACT|nr:phosphatase PAP2 family protein [Terriglobus roseus]SEC37321.1 acid phosphatase (class A) [Terriglobus roseus]
MRLNLFFFFVMAAAGAQQISPAPVERTSPWFNARTIDFVAATPAPPAAGSKLDRQDMREVLLAQRNRTTAEIQQAQADDKEEDIFIFAPVLGAKFNATELPLTAAFSQHLRGASAVINRPLKLRFGRPRPFIASAQVHPVCEKTSSNSFPSGHAMVGTLEALALTQIVPERSAKILHRLDQYTHNRVTCGVHYPSDVDASRTIASALFGLIAASPVFQEELASARAEVRNHLALPERSTDHAMTNISSKPDAVHLTSSAASPNGEGHSHANSE